MSAQEKFIDDFLSATDFQEPVEVTMGSVLRELPEWDSLAALGVIVMFDMEYGKVITGDDLEKVTTVGDLYQLLGL
ncbi:Acyl carrier protein [Pseudomonas sp. 8AS]|uniref:acyl carrier protein n=1 Tax=Pseudomonas sp. 8AS TaxID=2653163 RepID=UPI0012EFEE26|nr:acyl carrier protein [Pseudomonas sp. 8AS]VXB91152.1 Acyl carrier protein [Pseudomonas sp. 8AS]